MRRVTKTTLLAAVALVAAVACKESGSGLVLVFPDEGSRTAASTLSLWVLHPAPTGEAPLCDQLTRATGAIEPTAPTLVRDAVITDAPVDELLAGAGQTLESLPSGDKVIFVRVKDATGTVFLRGCTETNLGGGQSLELELEHLPGPRVDAMPDGGGPDGAGDPPDAADDPDLTVIVAQADNSTTLIPAARIIVTPSDGGEPRTATTDGAGRAVLADVASLARPWDVTVAADVVVGPTTYRGATSLIDVAPALTGGAYLVRVPLETAPTSTSGTGSLTGTISNLPGGQTADVLVRTPQFGPLTQTVVTSGPYTHAALRAPETYSVAMLVRDGVGVAVRVAVQLTSSLVAGTPTTLNFDAGTATTIDVPATVTLGATPAAFASATRTFGLDVLLPRGPIELRSVDAPVSPVITQAPSLASLPLGSVLLFRLVAGDASARVSGDARQEVATSAASYAASLTLPTPPTVTAPAQGATPAELAAQSLAIAWTGLFSTHSFVHVRLAGDAANTRYRWNLIYPRSTTSATVPTLPSGLPLLAAGVSYEITVGAIQAPGTFNYPVSIAGDFTTWTRAFNAPRRAWAFNTFSVTP